MNNKYLLLFLALLSATYSYSQLDTTSRNTGIPNYGRAIILADSITRARISDSAVVTLKTTQSIAAVKNIAPSMTGNGAAVSIAPTYTVTGNSTELYSLDVADPTIINNGGYTGITSLSARFRGSVLVGGTVSANVFKTNDLMRGGDVVYNIYKPSGNLVNALLLKGAAPATATSSMQNGTLFLDSLYFNANISSQGYTQVRLMPALTQTGYSGITRGLYITPALTNVTNFRAIETNVPYGKGYQLYLGGTAGNYLKSRTVIDSVWQFNDSVNHKTTGFLKEVSTNSFIYSTNGSISLVKPGNITSLTNTGDVLRFYVNAKSNIINADWNGIGMYDSLQIAQNINTGRVSALRLSPVVIQTGYSGPVRGLLIDPDLTATTDFRTIETSVNEGAGFQLYAIGTAPSYFKGRVGVNTNKPQSELAVNGTITAIKLKVTSKNWADYVFDSTYQLPALSIVEKQILQNKHLPEVPSAATVSKEGVNVGDNQVLLLKKIEELTLYIIEQNKKMEIQDKLAAQQDAEIELLKRRIK
ncbi:hypothetical protein SAMN05421788_1036 [Filimonas lacunae]|uniref:Peptidase S74 domain-containing protein n=1 Tax=Filimonas lacunae TaxID=477680 RepID=A0A173MJ48_9BACT|nr:hypothetical protein [Filimonas lacunae]BAV07655.1 hypothetical protein FLA_3686 [Filimonas lacunae]SIT03073.1 hypothetical protein SAMN05421788_1036 [Filimonas lacunae]